jgi:hypothetical protein
VLLSSEHNIFLAGRRSDNEDQLTEMLAWLVSVVPEAATALCALALPDLDEAIETPKVSTQYVIPGGRLDAILELEELVVVIESKLSSEYGPDQLRRYLDWLGKSPANNKVLMTLTAADAPWHPDEVKHAAELGISVSTKRWEELHVALESSLGSLDGIPERLITEFVDMLTQEGLIPMKPLGTSEVGHVWADSTQRIWRYHEFFSACVEAIGEQLEMDLRRGKSERIDYVYRSFINESDEVLFVGFDSTDAGNPVPSKRSKNAPTVWLAVDASNWPDWDDAGQQRLERQIPPGWSLNHGRRWGYAPQIWCYLDETLGDGPFEEQRRRLAEKCAVAAMWIDACRPERRKGRHFGRAGTGRR